LIINNKKFQRKKLKKEKITIGFYFVQEVVFDLSSNFQKYLSLFPKSLMSQYIDVEFLQVSFQQHQLVLKYLFEQHQQILLNLLNIHQQVSLTKNKKKRKKQNINAFQNKNNVFFSCSKKKLN